MKTAVYGVSLPASGFREISRHGGDHEAEEESHQDTGGNRDHDALGRGRPVRRQSPIGERVEDDGDHHGGDPGEQQQRVAGREL